MKLRSTIDDEWADKTIPNHDSLVPHALASDDSSEAADARAGTWPLLAIGSVLAMACALPVIGWAAHRPANGATADGVEAATQVAAPSPEAANPASESAPPPARTSPALDNTWPSPSALASGRSSEKTHKKHGAPGKHASDRVAGLASAVAGLASAAVEPPVGAVEAASAVTPPRSTAPPGAVTSDRPSTEPKIAASKQVAGHAATRGPSGASIEDQAAAELSSALK